MTYDTRVEMLGDDPTFAPICPKCGARGAFAGRGTDPRNELRGRFDCGSWWTSYAGCDPGVDSEALTNLLLWEIYRR